MTGGLNLTQARTARDKHWPIAVHPPTVHVLVTGAYIIKLDEDHDPALATVASIRLGNIYNVPITQITLGV